ncbi:MAG: hypothetical protein IPN14_07690 [Bacteroidetes bacterium]|nr:hypothetical protein [Bacteroidota bacterium]
MTNKLIITDIDGHILKSKSEFQHFDTCYVYQNAYKISTNEILLVGFKKNMSAGFYVNTIYIKSIDTNLNTIFEKIIPLNDTAKHVSDLSSMMTSKNTLLLVGTRDSSTGIASRKIFLYELTLQADSIRYAEYTIPTRDIRY